MTAHTHTHTLRVYIYIYIYIYILVLTLTYAGSCTEILTWATFTCGHMRVPKGRLEAARKLPNWSYSTMDCTTVSNRACGLTCVISCLHASRGENRQLSKFPPSWRALSAGAFETWRTLRLFKSYTQPPSTHALPIPDPQRYCSTYQKLICFGAQMIGSCPSYFLLHLFSAGSFRTVILFLLSRDRFQM